jgi:hypothetical protein
MNKGMGSWERHTRGIGAKLLLQVFQRDVHEVGYMLSYYSNSFIAPACNTIVMFAELGVIHMTLKM